MRRRWNRLSLELLDSQLERRELMSRPDGSAALVGQSHAGGSSVFHQNGINGFVLHRTFVNTLNDRLNNSKDQALLTVQAFQVFQTSFQALPVAQSPGTSGPTLDSLVPTLKQEVTTALIRREAIPFHQSPSAETSIKKSPLAPIALVPFADAQIDKMAAALEQLPPVTGPGSTIVQGNAIPAVNEAVNSILNALAEATIHPLLFNQPGDFYLNPNVTFTLSFNDIPAAAGPGYFIRGPHGAILPGATLHPFAPN